MQQYSRSHTEDHPLHVAIITIQKMNLGNQTLPSRINVENTKKLRLSGLTVGSRFNVTYEPGCITAIKNDFGTNIISPKSNRRRDGTTVIGERLDLRSSQIALNFGGRDKILAIYFANKLVFLHLPTVARNIERAQRLHTAIGRRKLNIAALYSGIGTLDAALHEGMAQGGFETQLSFVNDNWEVAIDALLNDHPATTPSTKTFAGGIEEFIASNVTVDQTDFAVLGIPCKGASRLNVATRDLPEMHPFAGHQVINALLALQKLGFPPLILIENVTAWVETVSFSMLVRVLKEQGYQTQLIGDYVDETYKGINSNDFGDIERRVRMALLAYPEGITLDFSTMRKTGLSTQTVGDIRLPEHLVNPGEYEKGLHLNSAHKVEKGWKNRIVSNLDRVTPTLSADCWKQRVEDPKFVHPIDPAKCRLPLPEEHCALKGHDLRLINSIMENSHAHTALGNGTAKKCWVELGRVLAEQLKTCKWELQKFIVAFQEQRKFEKTCNAQSDLFAIA